MSKYNCVYLRPATDLENCTCLQDQQAQSMLEGKELPFLAQLEWPLGKCLHFPFFQSTAGKGGCYELHCKACLQEGFTPATHLLESQWHNLQYDSRRLGKGKIKIPHGIQDSASKMSYEHTHEESKKGISAIWKKKNATNNEERNQAYDTVRERAEWIITSNPNASKTTEKRWAKTQ